MPKRPKAFAAAAGVALVTVGALAAHAGAITYLFDVNEPAVENSQNTRSISCGAGEKVIGGGSETQADFGKAVIVATRPDDGNDQGDKFDDGWQSVADFGDSGDPPELDSSAVCQGGKVASRLKLRQRQFDVAAFSVATKPVRCPRAYKVTGGGVDASGSYNTTEVEGTRPVDGGTAWEGRVRNFSANPGQMTVYAICATGRFAGKLVYRTESNTAPAGMPGDGHPACPAGGKPTGGGAVVKNAEAVFVAHYAYLSIPNWTSLVDAIGPAAPVRYYAVCKT